MSEQRLKTELAKAKEEIEKLNRYVNNALKHVEDWEIVTGLKTPWHLEVVDVADCESCDFVTEYEDLYKCSINGNGVEEAHFHEYIDTNCPLRRKPRLYRVKEGVE